MKTILTFLFFAAALSCVTAAVPVISSAASTTFTVGVPGSFTFTATNPPLTLGSWQDSSGSLPASLVLDPVTGKLSGTPLLGDVNVYTLSITVVNATGQSLPKTFTLTVRDVPRIVILKQSGQYTGVYYTYQHDVTNITSDTTDNILATDEIAAETAYSPGTFSGTETLYYILDMVDQKYSLVRYYSFAASGSSPAQKHYVVDVSGAPFTDGFIDALLASRTANTLDVVFGKANPDAGLDPNLTNDDMTSYHGLASSLAVTTATATIPAWTIPYAVKSFSGKSFSFFDGIFPITDDMGVEDPLRHAHQFESITSTFTTTLDTVLTPQANTGPLLQKIDPNTGLPLAGQFYDGVLSNTFAYGVQLVRNSLEKLKYSESP